MPNRTIQTGRHFVCAEAYASVSRFVHVGKIAALQRLDRDFGTALTERQSWGKPHRLAFEVRETLRGESVRRLELVLSLQHTLYLDYLCNQGIPILLVGGPTPLDHFPRAEVGIEEQGRRLENEAFYQFRVLDPLREPKAGVEKEIASQLNTYYDSGRMFTNTLDVIRGSRAILKHVRTFAKKYPQTLSTTTLSVPNEFGALCGSPNAFCGITLPLCAETRVTLERLKADPGRILRRIKPRDPQQDHRAWLLTEVDRALAVFSTERVG